ncbi:hypothetical protein BaRGS_00005318 [Batillaria attramentaria]|uniref:Uncharacterized protein n=1 Tax=Batillaria attramentaria TaxID=370345 RepID=A0ABD0LWP4_9CAEN
MKLRSGMDKAGPFTKLYTHGMTSNFSGRHRQCVMLVGDAGGKEASHPATLHPSGGGTQVRDGVFTVRLLRLCPVRNWTPPD